MAEEKMSNERRVTLFNQGARTYQTTSGLLHPRASLEVPEAEAVALLGYPDIIDLSKMSPKTVDTIDSLRAENAKLKAEVEKLKHSHQEAKEAKKK